MGKKTVLIVDNSEIIQSSLGDSLTAEGYTVERAYDGMEALQKVYSSPPDVILLDLIMPKINGDRVCRYLKGNPQFRHIPIVILSGVASEAEKTIKTLGADAYIVKDRSDTILHYVLEVLRDLEGKVTRGKPPVLGIERVTSRQLVKELLEMKTHYESILESMAEGVIETDTEGTITFANAEALRILSLDEGSTMGMECSAIFAPQPVESCLRFGSPRESLTVHRNGKIIKVNLSPLLQDKEIIGLTAILEDVTERERLRKDVEEAHRRLIQSEKLAATSKLAAGIAHEIKNPLNSLSFTVANIEQIITTARTVKDIRKTSQDHLTLITSDIDRIKLLVDRFMSFARPKEILLAKKDIRDILRSAVASVRPRADSQRVTVLDSYDDDVQEAMVEEEEMFRSFVNLLTNSLDAMEDGGTLTVSCSGSPEGIVVTIADSGTGIPEDIQDKVFDIFFTTKPKGSGLGLSQVYRTVESLGGKISLRSPLSDKKGTEFTVVFPEKGRP